MRIAIFGDVHANARALRTVLSGIDMAGIGHLCCLGDFAFGGPDAAECFDLVSNRCQTVLAGNWEWQTARTWEAGDPRIRYACMYGEHEQLGSERMRQILDLQPYARFPDLGVELAHASLPDHLFDFVRDASSAQRCLDHAAERLVVVGHTHIAAAFGTAADGAVQRVKMHTNVVFPLGETRWVLNPGPAREGNPRRSHHSRWLELALNNDGGTVIWHRVRQPET